MSVFEVAPLNRLGPEGWGNRLGFLSSKSSRAVRSDHLSVPSVADHPDGTGRWVLIRPFWLRGFVLDPMFTQLGLEFRVPTNLFICTVTDQCLWRSVFLYKPINGFIRVSLPLYRICRRKEFLVREYLAASLSVCRIASHVHRVRCECACQTVRFEHAVYSISSGQWHQSRSD